MVFGLAGTPHAHSFLSAASDVLMLSVRTCRAAGFSYELAPSTALLCWLELQHSRDAVPARMGAHGQVVFESYINGGGVYVGQALLPFSSFLQPIFEDQ